jgi:enterochelin esterase-like enzyme
VSAGGYGAMHLALKHLDQFGAVESWSGYFHPTDPTGTRSLDLGSTGANAAANVHRQLQASRGRLRALQTFIAFYVGRDDTRFVGENRELNTELTRAGIPHVFRVYPGGHDQALWQRYAAPWLTLALDHLSPATG